jgi:hypothetical protein
MATDVHTQLNFLTPPVGEFTTLIAVIDGGGAAIAAGVKGDLGPLPAKLQPVEWTLLADQAGSIVIDLWKDTYANFPPTVADSVTASAKPTLSGAAKAQSSALTGWTTTWNEGETLRVNVDSAATVTRVTLAIKCKKIA